MSNPDACEPDSFVAEVGWLVQNGRVYVNAADLVDVLREADCGNLADDFLRIATEELAAHADRHGLAGFTVSASAANDPERAFQELTREKLEELYMGALETIVELEERFPIRHVTNEPGTSWEINDGVLAIRRKP